MKYETITAKDKHTISYRFTCEHCGFTTKWYPIEIERAASASSGFSQSSVSEQAKRNTSSSSVAAVQKRIDEIRAQVEKGEYHIDYMPQKGEGTADAREMIFSHYQCPKCKAYPSWIRSTIKKQAGIGLSLLLGLGLPVLWFGAIMLSSGDWPKKLGGWSFLIALGLFIIGIIASIIINNSRISRRLKMQGEPAQTLLPEINWNGR